MEKVQSCSRKRKRGEKVFRFESFCAPRQPILFSGSFRDNVKALLDFGHQEDGVHEGMQFWSFRLELHQYPSTFVRMFIAEEAVGLSQNRQCLFCRFAGWGHHMISNKRFHFVLPFKKTKSDVESLSIELGRNRPGISSMGSKLMGSQGKHLMHGIMHSNGYGHLITVNGIEGGSDFISGHQIMDLWDRICTALHVRKVSITDSAKKGSMELRLIHGLVYGQPWFSRWDYKLSHGSYGVTPQMYQTSLEALRTLPLSILLPNFASIIAKYQTLSGLKLQTIADLTCFITELNRRLPPNTPSTFDCREIISEPTCRWSMKRVEMAAQVIVGALKKSKCRWVTRQEVRDAARAYIGDTGLLDYVLKSLGNHIVGNYVVRRMVNPITKILEYCLQDVSTVFPSLDHFGSLRFHVTRSQLKKDMMYLYNNIFGAHSTLAADGVFRAILIAARVILDAKHLVKDYKVTGGSLQDTQMKNNDQCLKVMCTIRIMNNQEKKELPPYEMFTFQLNATIGDLKRETEKKFRVIYLGLKSFTAESVAGLNAEDTDFIVGVLVELGNKVIVEGRVVNNADEIYEGGKDVDCHCGGKEEDGEVMVCCDICGIWQHARCAGIEDEEEDVPRVFLCNLCENNISALPPIQY
ncbi:uncharacterized protein A4U43_C06F15570 [Asparagus officinalis]|uniref:Zinc finger PHD-type domain-containing protein n=1 Tax=Asparagus officinalis TaxID=4686 RepID=A0A5P1EM51_ASPOF|nr:PHD finger protein PERSISTENT TAPETAL CELL 1 [Asparagus officinalis]ONK67088.1 uncharacterized protein A4U43_C06F15570 [Asparagus officinalis]